MSLNLGLKSSDVPVLQPVSIIIPAGTTQTISFPNQFFGRAISIRISNNDLVNTATYQINGESRAILTLAATGNRSINDTVIELITIVAGAAGSVQIEAQVLLIE